MSYCVTTCDGCMYYETLGNNDRRGLCYGLPPIPNFRAQCGYDGMCDAYVNSKRHCCSLYVPKAER